MTRESGFDSWRNRYFHFVHRFQTVDGTDPPHGTTSCFPMVKELGHEAEYSPPDSAEILEGMELYLHKNECWGLFSRG
jgi:hypothetical protein